MVKKFRKDVTQFGKAVIGIGIGSTVVAGLPTTPASAPLGQGLATAARFTPIIATGIGASAALRQVRKLQKKKKRRR